MTLDQTLRQRAAVPILAVLGFAGLAAVLVSLGSKHLAHAPNLALFMAQSPVLKAHVAAAVAAFLLGLVMFATAKGRAFHRAAGWVWVALMAVVAGSSLFLVGLNGHSYSFIHLITGFTLIVLPLGVIAAKRHEVKQHRRRMTGLFLGGMVIAGAFTFLPGRLMWALFFG